MQIVVRRVRLPGAGVLDERDVDVDTHAGVTVGDLVASLDSRTQRESRLVLVDGRSVPIDLGLDEAGLVSGSLLDLIEGDSEALESTEGTQRPAGRRLTPALAVTGGLSAGRWYRLDDGPTAVGSARDASVVLADPTVSAHHVRLTPSALVGEVLVEAPPTRNGTTVDGHRLTGETTLCAGASLDLGATTLALRAPTEPDPPANVDPCRSASAGKIAFNRPPREMATVASSPISVPDVPAGPSKGMAINVAVLLGPLIMGGAMVLLLGNVRYAAFALMGPVMLVMTWASSKRTAKVDGRRSSRAFALSLVGFEAALEDASHRERQHRLRTLSDLAEVTRRAAQPSTRLWERRQGHADFMLLRVGRGTAIWQPPVDMTAVDRDPELVALVDSARCLGRTPIGVDMGGGGVIGIAGPERTARAVARGLLLQAAVHHGPADCQLAVMSTTDSSDEWDWVKWLPHVGLVGGVPTLAAGRTQVDALANALAAEASDEGRGDRPLRVVVVDDASLVMGRGAPVRALLRAGARAGGGSVVAIVTAASKDLLPSVCDTVIQLVGAHGAATVSRPLGAAMVDELVVDGVDVDTARDCARRLARFDDADASGTEARVPSSVLLLDVLDLGDVSALTIAQRWARGGDEPHLRFPIGAGVDGTVTVDLVEDGPHGLIGGTTGSGKSELLRTIVAGLAATVDPDHLVFVLVDYKGGSAFDACADLPHVVGVVTDLDEHLGGRALRSLEAELRHREAILRQVAVTDIGDYLRLGSPAGPLPRLVVAVDEFAALAQELPTFIGSLVGIAQRGRSLGIHILLATQRPSGVVNANIVANTNLRIALRVQDPADSFDVVDVADAASIAPETRGRALLRRGPGPPELVQTALSTGYSGGDARAITTRPFVFGQGVEDVGPPTAGESDLDRLVAAIGGAFEQSGRPGPRRPWLSELASQVEFALDHDPGCTCPSVHGSHVAPGGSETSIVFAVADEPDNQRTRPLGWDMATGHLALLGALGSGTSTALRSAILAATARRHADDLHVYVVDAGSGDHESLARLDHIGAVIGATEEERIERLVGWLDREVDRRRPLTVETRRKEPAIMIAIDGLPSLLGAYEGIRASDSADRLQRVMLEGAQLGLHFAVTAPRVGALSVRVAAAFSHRLLFQHADPADFAAIGQRPKDLPRFVPGRAIDALTGLEAQVGVPTRLDDALAVIAAKWSSPSRLPSRMPALPACVDVAPASCGVDGLVDIPVGIDGVDHRVASLTLGTGDHALLAGPRGSGISSVLALLAGQVGVACPDDVMVAVASPRSALRSAGCRLDASGTFDELLDVLTLAARGGDRRWTILVDDAHDIGRPGAAGSAETASLLESLTMRRSVRVIAGGRVDLLAGGYGHWTRALRRCGIGLLLMPRLDTDGELLGVRLPRRVAPPMVPGRGFLVERGDATIVQCGRLRT